MFSAAIKSGAAGNPTDPKFNYVTMLLHGDGTNGAQNNTFLDSSTNNFTITRNGNTTQGTFTPYGSNWSVYNDGTSYLSLSANSALNQSGDLTIEGWVNLSATPSVIVPIYSFENANFLKVGFNSSRQVTVDQSQVGIKVTGTTAVALGTWNHIALVRSGSSSNNCKIYLNGVQEGQFTDTTTCTVSGTGYIFRRSDNTTTVAGYLSNLRVTNTAVYTSAFTPSTTPLTAVTGTSLLSCQSNYFKDNSSNAFAISTSGTPSVQRFSPFSPTTAYSTSVIGGSGYFDGSGDYLVTPNNSALYLSTNNFTVECWIYLTSSSSSNIIRGTAQYSFGILYSGGSLVYYLSANGSTWGIANGVNMGSIALNTWTHVALVRNGSTFTPYINGVAGTTTTSASAIAATNGFYVFAEATGGGSGPSYGYCTDFRVVNGLAVYTSNFTPSTTPLTAITNTSLLLSYTNAGILDNAMMNDLETVGNAQISTSVKKYGSGAMSFNGSTDKVVTKTSPNMYMTGAFTIECWVYWTGTSLYYQNFVGSNDTFTSNASFFRVWGTSAPVNANKIGIGNPTHDGSSSVFSTNSLPTNTWTHVAATRDSSNIIRVFINGNLEKTGSTDTSIYDFGQGGTCIGDSPWDGAQGWFSGYIDDLRITKGVARYTTTFTPPTAAFPNN